MVIGKAGVGKSYLINSLLGSTIARESHTDDIGTQEITKYDYQGVNIFDTPGLFDSDTDPKIALKHYIGIAKPSILIVCYDSTERRLSDQDLRLIKLLKELFGDAIIPKTIFVFTQVNLLCSRDGQERTDEIIASKYATIHVNGGKNIITSGSKDDVICKTWLGKITWMEDFWKITISIIKSNPTIILSLPSVKPGNTYSKTAYDNAMQNSGGCISQNTKLGGKFAKDLKVGDIITQNGQDAQILFVYKHDEPQYMVILPGAHITAEHYILENGKYIKAKDSEYIMGELYGPVMYVVTELDDLYFDSGFVASTYVWDYWIMKILHIPFRIILSLVV